MYFAVIIGAALLVELLLTVKGLLKPVGSSSLVKMGSPTELGRLLFTKYLYPFEITSILIIAAIVGAIVLVKKRENE